MSKLNLPIQFILLLALSLVLAFGLHLGLLSNSGLPLYDNLIVLSYVVNAVLAAAIFGLLYRFRIRLKNNIGFLFMGGSLIKFAVFFLLFYPTYKADGDISSVEFAAFFAPYAIALFLETYFTSQMLKKLEKTFKE